MTQKEFFELLSKTKGWFFQNWGFDKIIVIRKRSHGFDICPVSALANKKAKRFKYRSGNFDDAGEYLGLPKKLVKDIANAADNTSMNPYRTRLRKKLLKACKLS